MPAGISKPQAKQPSALAKKVARNLAASGDLLEYSRLFSHSSVAPSAATAAFAKQHSTPVSAAKSDAPAIPASVASPLTTANKKCDPRTKPKQGLKRPLPLDVRDIPVPKKKLFYSPLEEDRKTVARRARSPAICTRWNWPPLERLPIDAKLRLYEEVDFLEEADVLQDAIREGQSKHRGFLKKGQQYEDRKLHQMATTFRNKARDAEEGRLDNVRRLGRLVAAYNASYDYETVWHIRQTNLLEQKKVSGKKEEELLAKWEKEQKKWEQERKTYKSSAPLAMQQGLLEKKKEEDEEDEEATTAPEKTLGPKFAVRPSKPASSMHEVKAAPAPQKVLAPKSAVRPSKPVAVMAEVKAPAKLSKPVRTEREAPEAAPKKVAGVAPSPSLPLTLKPERVNRKRKAPVVDYISFANESDDEDQDIDDLDRMLKEDDAERRKRLSDQENQSAGRKISRPKPRQHGQTVSSTPSAPATVVTDEEDKEAEEQAEQAGQEAVDMVKKLKEEKAKAARVEAREAQREADDELFGIETDSGTEESPAPDSGYQSRSKPETEVAAAPVAEVLYTGFKPQQITNNCNHGGLPRGGWI